MNKPIRVLIVDDSASVRQSLKQVLETDPDIQVMGTAADPYVAAEHIKREVPDVITLDVEMPRMDGLTFLERLMSQHPIPVVICSTLTEAGSESGIAALEKGAVDIITKPKLGTKEFFQESCIRICDAVKSAALTRNRPAAPSFGQNNAQTDRRCRHREGVGFNGDDPDHREDRRGGRIDRRD